MDRKKIAKNQSRKKIAKNQSRKKKATDYITKVLTDINKHNKYNKYTASSDADPEYKRVIEEFRLKLSIQTIKKGIDAQKNEMAIIKTTIADPSLTSEARNLLETNLLMINKKLRELELAYSLAENDLEIFYVTEKDHDDVDEDNYDELHDIREQLLKQIEAHSNVAISEALPSTITDLNEFMSNVAISEALPSTSTDLNEIMSNVAISEALPSTSTDVLMQDDAKGQKGKNKKRVTRRRRRNKRRTRRRRRRNKK